MNRRDFLKSSLAVSALPILPSLDWLQTSSSSAEPILILGAGAAGLAAAYELRKAKIPFLILESSDRVGGRIWTQSDFNSDGQYIERGAEFIDSNQETLLNLASDLGVVVEDLKVQGQEPHEFLYFVEGRYRSDQELVEACRPLVKAIFRDRKKILGSEHGDLNCINYRTHLSYPEAQKFDDMNLADYLQALTGHVPSWALKAVEATFVGEYGLPAQDQSALNLLSLMATGSDPENLLGDSDESKRVQGGNSKLIEALFKAVIAGSPLDEVIRFNSRVSALKQTPKGFEVTIMQNDVSRVYRSRQVICTVPFAVARHWQGWDQVSLSPAKRQCLNELGYGTNTKVFLGFEDRFWNQLPADQQWTRGLLTDLSSLMIWETSRTQAGSRGVLTFYPSGEAGATATIEYWRQARLELEKITGKTPLRPKEASVQNWTLSPTSRGSYTCLKPGQWTRIWGAAHESECHGRLHFAGEHCSLDFQGYMNGALETGMRAARQAIRTLTKDTRLTSNPASI